ncbi:unnamed protein product, partial [Discosporangium mesarthrocarpum]
AFCPPLSRFEGKALLFWPQRSWDRRKAVFSTETGPFNAGRREAVGGWGAVNSRHALPLSMVSGVSKSARFSVAGIKSLAGISWKVKRGNLWDSVVPIVNPEKLVLYIVFQIVYARALRLLYQVQIQVWRLVRKHDPPPYSESVLGFLEPRLHMLSRVLALVYLLNGAVGIMIASGWNIQPSLAKVMSDVIYCWYMGYFIDKAKQFTLPVWIPSLRADKRKGFIYNRSLSVFTWSVCALYVVEIISVFLRIPITSTLAFGGIGGLAFGLAGKDVLSNFFGGLMLLLAEPFIPGDMVTFQRNGVRCEGRVERVGWYQTRLRGRDTRPTYVPNSVFVDSMVTNMDRITHRKFETNFELRYDDLPKVTAIVQGIRAALKEVPNIDLLSPFRVHLVDFSPSGLKFTVVCYFATKSFDEFLYLQQVTLLEVARVADEAGATMMSVYHLDMSNP